MLNRLNIEAGAIPSPTEPIEIAIAQRSAAVIWRAFPYFQVRYGERGKRFGVSDCGYLVVIAKHGQQYYQGQVLWLAQVLANRGMPTWLLEQQLLHLSRSGARCDWPHAPVVEFGYRLLADQRRRVLSDDDFRELGIRFATQARLPMTRLAIGLGQIVAAAFVDVQNEITPSAASVTDWIDSVDTPAKNLARASAAIESLPRASASRATVARPRKPG